MTATSLPEVADGYRHPRALGNPILDLNPLTTLWVITPLIVIGIALGGWVPPLGVSALFVLIALFAGRGGSYLSLLLKLWLAVGLILFVLRALLTPGKQILIPLGPISVTAEGIELGLEFTMLVMSICGGVTLFFALVPMRRLTIALERLGVSPRASYVILASFQAITDLGATAKVVLEAQKARGVETEGSLFVRVRAFFPVLAPVFLSAMSATEERAIALDARAFNSAGKHTSLIELPATPKWEIVLAALLLLAAIGAIVGGALGWL